jgi:hypothetical protein
MLTLIDIKLILTELLFFDDELFFEGSKFQSFKVSKVQSFKGSKVQRF